MSVVSGRRPVIHSIGVMSVLATCKRLRQWAAWAAMYRPSS